MPNQAMLFTSNSIQRVGSGSLQCQPGGGSVEFRPAGGNVAFFPAGGSLTCQPGGGSLLYQSGGGSTQFQVAGGSVQCCPPGGSFRPAGGSVEFRPAGGCMQFQVGGGQVVGGQVMGGGCQLQQPMSPATARANSSQVVLGAPPQCALSRSPSTELIMQGLVCSQGNIAGNYVSSPVHRASAVGSPMCRASTAGTLVGSPLRSQGVFDNIDRNHDGVITRQEFAQAVGQGSLCSGRCR